VLGSLRRLVNAIRRPWQPSREHLNAEARVSEQEERAERVAERRRERLQVEYDAVRHRPR